MVHQRPTIDFEDIPLDQARTMGRGPRIDPALYQELRARMQSLSDRAVRMTLPEGTRPIAMKHRLLRVAIEIKVPVTVRRVPGGLVFWRSTDEDVTGQGGVTTLTNRPAATATPSPWHQTPADVTTRTLDNT